MRLNTLNGVKSDIKDKITLYCAFQYTLSGIVSCSKIKAFEINL